MIGKEEAHRLTATPGLPSIGPPDRTPVCPARPSPSGRRSAGPPIAPTRVGGLPACLGCQDGERHDDQHAITMPPAIDRGGALCLTSKLVLR